MLGGGSRGLGVLGAPRRARCEGRGAWIYAGGVVLRFCIERDNVLLTDVQLLLVSKASRKTKATFASRSVEAGHWLCLPYAEITTK